MRYSLFPLGVLYIAFVCIYVGSSSVCIHYTLEMHQVKGGRMDYIFWFLIALIGITPKVLRELGIILYIVLKYKRRH